MRNRIALLATAAALAVTPVVAQQTTTPAPSQPAPQAQPAPQTERAPGGMTKSFINAQTADQWSASKLIGLKVIGNGDENIGSISDLLLTDDGKVVAAVIGVGGFLGIGKKDVAVAFDALDISRDADGAEQAKVSMTKEQLEGAPEFKGYEPQRSARTGSPSAPKKPSGM